MDGTALYEGVATPFISQVYSIHLNISFQIIILLTALLTTIGATDIPGTSLIAMVLVLITCVEGINLILGTSSFLDFLISLACFKKLTTSTHYPKM